MFTITTLKCTGGGCEHERVNGYVCSVTQPPTDPILHTHLVQFITSSSTYTTCQSSLIHFVVARQPRMKEEDKQEWEAGKTPR